MSEPAVPRGRTAAGPWGSPSKRSSRVPKITRTQALLDGFVTERLFRPVGGAGTEGTLVVLHDLPTGAMAHLPSLLDRAVDEGAQFSSDFAPSCVVLERGVPRDALDGYVRATP
jgi:hypothetical protein